MSDLVPVDNTEKRVELFDQTPTAMVGNATVIANELSRVIDTQGLYSEISGKKYVKLEGWNLLGSLLAILPKERDVKELPDGSYEASVELVSMKTGMVVGCGSAICSVTEKRWANAEKFARRSMAITRATGKAYRLGLSWIINLAGYQATPFEEIDGIDLVGSKKTTKAPKKTKPKEPEFYEDTTEMKQILFAEAKRQGLDETKEEDVKLMKDVHTLLIGKPLSELPVLVSEAVQESTNG